MNSQSHKAAASIARIAALVALCVIAILIAIPNFLGGRGGHGVAHMQSDMRSLSTAIESYYTDHREYPAWSTIAAENAFSTRPKLNHAIYDRQPTFMHFDSKRGIAGLTTPVAYLTSYFEDPFSPTKGQVFSYWSKGSGWILWSPGPDMKFDLSIDNIAQAYDPAAKDKSPTLVNLTYDPTNGTASSGDVWRPKQ